MQLGILTASYKTTPVEIREKLAVPENEIKGLIATIKSECVVEEVMVLSTCNRVELYFQCENHLKTMDAVEQSFFKFLKIDPALDLKMIRIQGEEAVKHIFRVAASLESMVIGEPQITGQVKDFFHLSVEAGGCGYLLNQIMNRAFTTAKRVRNETGIAKFAVSISFAATELAKKIFNDLQEKTVLIIGAGEMAELAVSHLMKAGCSQLLVTNRTFSRAVSLAEKFNGSAVRFEQMQHHMETADIVISSTGARGFILERKLIQKAMKKRKYRPMFFIDIAVPRDIDPEINEVSSAYVYDIDDLQTVVDSNLKVRQKEAEESQKIIDEELDRIQEWLATLDVVPTIKMFREQILTLANEELQKGLSQLGELTAKQERSVRAMVNGLAYKILHQPTVMLKQKAKEGSTGLEHVQLLHELFALKEFEKPQKQNKVIPIK